jgi:plasmid stabilization system protein ParE
VRYRYDPRAVDDLEEACDYYDSKQRGLGGQFIQAYEDALASVLEHPTRWAAIGGGCRLCRLKRFPYGILYRPLEPYVHIVAVVHLSRKSTYWQDRLGDQR